MFLCLRPKFLNKIQLYMKRCPTLIAIGTMLLMTACNDDYFNKNNDHEYSDYIGFNVNVTGDQFQSRATGTTPSHGSRRLTIDATGASIGDRPLYLLTEISSDYPEVVREAEPKAESRGVELNTANLEEIRVSAVVFDGEWGATDFAPQPYMNNDLVDLTSGWNTGRYWPRENDWIRFYAHGPADVLSTSPNDIGGIPFPEGANEPSFAYTVPDNVADQKDLLVASAQYKGDKCEKAHLEFGHALTAVEIKISEEVEGFTLTSLTISGLQNEGTYTYKWAEEYVDAGTGNNGDGNSDTPTHDAGSWTGQDGSATYTVFPRPAKEGETQTSELELNGNGADLTADGMLLLLMPQTLSDEAKIELKGIDFTGEAVTLSAMIGGTDAQGKAKQWEAGKRVVYTLTFDSYRIEYHLEVTPTKSVNDNGYYISPYHGETAVPFTVNCYKQTVSAGGTIDEGPTAVAWEIDSETRPWWVDQITTSGIGSGTGDTPFTVTGTYSVLPNLTSSTSHSRLSSQSIKGSEAAPWDLSADAEYSGTPRNTANCYMVSAPGWYTFPLVYGNAIKDGSPNPESYLGDTSTDTESATSLFTGIVDARNYSKTAKLADGTEVQIPIYTLKDFFGSYSDIITTPWIVSNNNRGGKYSPGEVEVLWQDEPCLISDVKLNEEGDYIIFRVREESINEGNAVISLNIPDDNDKSMWSWHIWVTDQIDGLSGDFSNPVAMTNRMVTANYDADATTASGLGKTSENLFYLMHSNLGGCDADKKKYTEALAGIRFKIMENDVEVVENKAERIHLIIDNAFLNVGVSGTEITMPYNAPYYQFGRKDPMLPGWPGANPNAEKNDDPDSKPFYKHNREKGRYGEKFVSENRDFQVYKATYIDHHMSLIRYPNVFFKGTSDINIYSGETPRYPNLLYHLYTDESDGEGENGELVKGRQIYINKWNAKCNKLPIFTFYNKDAASLYSIFKEVMDFGVTKTVYDPCPPGYEIPRIDAFSGTTFSSLNVNNWTTSNLVNVANIIKPGPYGDYEAIGFYTSPMPSTGTGTGSVFYVRALGHRNHLGEVSEYNNYGSAFTASPICAQWTGTNNVLNTYFQFEAGRFCYTGSGWMRPFSSSAFDLAFPVIPAMTNGNPSTTTINGSTNWGGDHSDLEVGF